MSYFVADYKFGKKLGMRSVVRSQLSTNGSVRKFHIGVIYGDLLKLTLDYSLHFLGNKVYHKIRYDHLTYVYDSTALQNTKYM
jgi:hypothetical protein